MKKIFSTLLLCSVFLFFGAFFANNTAHAQTISQSGTTPLYRYYNGAEHFYTTSFSELGNGKDGYSFEGVQCHVYTSSQSGTTPLYRYYNGTEHFYTTSFDELGSGKSGYSLEGIQCYVLP